MKFFTGHPECSNCLFIYSTGVLRRIQEYFAYTTVGSVMVDGNRALPLERRENKGVYYWLDTFISPGNINVT